MFTHYSSTLERINKNLSPIDLDVLGNAIGDARIVLLGESTQGTHEFYRHRAEISKYLIENHQFNAIAVEADWPDALNISRYVQAASGSSNPLEALNTFDYFPQWKWRNQEMVQFIRWLRVHNTQLSLDKHSHKIGFYGLDLYSLNTSIQHVLHYLEQVDPKGAQEAKKRYACFDHFDHNSQSYSMATAHQLSPDCQQEAISQLVALTKNAERYLHFDGMVSTDEFFYAQQNAQVVRDAEAYYRAMFEGRISAWNIRDTHMANTLESLQKHLATRLPASHPAKIIVWAHNSHIGDARATEREEYDQLNLGQLVRERSARLGPSFLLGFTTYQGKVMAAKEWNTPGIEETVPPALAESYEHLFHEVTQKEFLLLMNKDPELKNAFCTSRLLERAIGPIYRAETERLSHYFHTDIAHQFDAIIHIDTTKALHPLDTVITHTGHGVEQEPLLSSL